MRIAGAALNQIPFDWNHNLRTIREAIEQAKAAGVELLCLPELCLTGYGCEDLFLSDWLPESALAHLQQIRPWTNGILVCVGLPIRLNHRTYNTAAVLRDGEILGFAAKQFLANDGVHYEPRWFTSWRAGETGTVAWEGQQWPIGDLVFEHQGVRFGFEICEDAWRPDDERPACRLMGRVDLIVNPSASHFAMSKTDVRYNLVLNASRNFRCTYLYANLLGNEAGRMIYDGEILVARNGHLLLRNQLLSFKEVDMECVDVDFQADLPLVETIAPLPVPDEYRELNQALSLALFDYLRKARSRGFVLSLSGGADSCMCAVGVAEMVRLGVAELGVEEFKRRSGCFEAAKDVVQQTGAGGAALQKTEAAPAALSSTGLSENQQLVRHLLTCAYQGTVNSSDDTYTSAKELADSLGAVFFNWEIDQEVTGYVGKIEHALGRPLTWQTDDLALQNIQARVRAPGIWMLANVLNCLLLTTSNRSEASVGYCTMDGDTAGSISPIAGVDKDFVKKWLRWAETELGYPGLRHVNALQPTAELRPLEDKQTDERDLMPYVLLNRIERLAFYNRLSPAQVLATLVAEEKGYEPEQLKTYVRRFYTLWSRNQWKRERYAPAFHLDDYNVDPRSWLRFPILSGGFQQELNAL
ncbi:NAD+ synthase (glutamine-hydrolysing) [Hymenobacter daecheongensis DSM 21074]|uniref:Glutamine-dependent NAD(+) synthetase n=1 Tax=Hymenobacter daecheongensis DSM 21074 TaxID=1121955 RepID=A0A1M6GL43_9BACT|nr:NAD(+) synthase [Hymenobacter daecheongensis]SHJ10654.1 NAD+ synthase (glutamine-hydrolysing) [Hymenobacter daecheongensis DSM 21074]